MTKDSAISLCGCLLEVPTDQISRFFRYPGVDLVEWRLDCFLQRLSVEALSQAFHILNNHPRHPILATNRPQSQGGHFEGPESLRIDLLQKAVEAGAEWVDLEDELAASTFAWFRQHNAKILVSHHDFAGTPDREGLRRLLQDLAAKQADAVKIVTYAHSPADNLRVLDLIPLARQELAVDLIAFCMGPLGRWSRLAAPLLGSPWTYVQLPGQSAAAAGQLTAEQMHSLLEMLA
jgi:3-dehydroquinate dehydratase I